MSFNNANILIQQFVSNYGNTGRTYNVFPFVRAVSSANNQVILDPNTFLKGPGKLRQVRLTYWPILCDVEGDCNDSLCDDGTRREPKQIMFDITRCTAIDGFSVAKDDIRLLDNGAWDFTGTAQQIIASMMPAARRLLAIDWLTRLYDLAGVHPDGNASKRITVTNPANGIVNPMGRIQINREYSNAGFMQPYILGGDEVDNWMQMTAMGGLNAQGQYINRSAPVNAWYDEGLSDTILGDEANGGHIITIAPETFKYVYYLENAGIFRTEMTSISDMDMLYKKGTNGFIEGTLIDPVTGIPWDLYINYEKCDQQWVIRMKHRWEFFVMPDVACSAQGVNGLMTWRTCPPVIATCPTGDTPSPALALSTFSWTPGDIFPFYAATSNIGGVENQPDVLVTNLAGLAAVMNDNYVGSAVFEVNGSDIEYDGYEGITVDFNGTITGTFTV